MNKGLKVIIGLVSLLLILFYAVIALLFTQYPLNQTWQEFRFDLIDNQMIQAGMFWIAVALIIIVFVACLVLLFMPTSQRDFTLKSGNGRLSIDRKAIEGLVRSRLRVADFVSRPKISVKATNKKIDVQIKGDLSRTSSLVGHTKELMDSIQQQIESILGSSRETQVKVIYKGYESKVDKRPDSSRVE